MLMRNKQEHGNHGKIIDDTNITLIPYILMIKENDLIIAMFSGSVLRMGYLWLC